MPDMKECLDKLRRLESMRKTLALQEVPLLYIIASDCSFPVMSVVLFTGGEPVVKKMKKVGAMFGVRYFFNPEDSQFYSGLSDRKRVVKLPDGRRHSYTVVVMLRSVDRDWFLLARAVLHTAVALKAAA